MCALHTGAACNKIPLCYMKTSSSEEESSEDEDEKEEKKKKVAIYLLVIDRIIRIYVVAFNVHNTHNHIVIFLPI